MACELENYFTKGEANCSTINTIILVVAALLCSGYDKRLDFGVLLQVCYAATRPFPPFYLLHNNYLGSWIGKCYENMRTHTCYIQPLTDGYSWSKAPKLL